MPRSLPWLNANGGPAKPTRTTTTRTPAAKRARTTAPPRTKSAPSSDAPPHIEYMHPSDDEWVMVEDEFLSTANLFTRSIHQAEYARMQEAASRANARQITNISRPTISNPVIRRIQQSQASQLPPKQEEEDEDEFKAGGVELRGMMRANTAAGPSLGKLISHKPVATRARAGLKEARAKEDGARVRHREQIRSPSAEPPQRKILKHLVPARDGEGDVTTDDDLDARPRRAAVREKTLPPSRPPLLKPVSNRPPTARVATKAPPPTATHTENKVPTKCPKSRPVKAEKSAEKPAEKPADDFDFFSFSAPVTQTKFRGRSAAVRLKTQTEEKAKKSSGNGLFALDDDEDGL